MHLDLDCVTTLFLEQHPIMCDLMINEMSLNLIMHVMYAH